MEMFFGWELSCPSFYNGNLMLFCCFAELHLMQAVLTSSARDPDNATRKAANAALNRLPLSAGLLAPLLAVHTHQTASPQIPTSPPPSASKRQKKTPLSPTAPSKSSQTPAETPHQGPLPAEEVLDGCVSALEVLHWKDDIIASIDLMAPLSRTISGLLGLQSQASVSLASGSGVGEAAEEEDLAQGGALGGPAALELLPTTVAYALELSLGAVQRVARSHVAHPGLQELDLSVIIKVCGDNKGSIFLVYGLPTSGCLRILCSYWELFLFNPCTWQ